MKEGLFFSLLTFSGHGLFVQIFGRYCVLFGVAAAVPLGMLLWTVLAVVLTLGGVEMRHAFWLLVLLCGYYCWAAWRHRALTTFVAGLTAAGVALLISIFSVRFGWVQISFDSVEQLAVGRALAQTGLKDDLGTLLASWGVLLPLVQGAGAFLGVDLLSAMQPLLWLALLGILAATAWQIRGPHPAWITLLAVSLVATSYFFVFQSAYIHNSLVSATFLLLFMAAIVLAVRESRHQWIDLSFLSLFGFTLARTEAPLFSALAIFLVASLFDRGPLWPRFQRLTIIYVVSATAWCLALMMLIGTGSDIMTPGRIAVLIAALLGAAMVVSWPSNRFSTGLRAWLPVIVIAASLVAVLCSYLWKPEHTLQNIHAIAGNLLFNGRWASTWWMVAFALPLLMALSAGQQGRVFMAFCVAFSSLVVLMGVMRIPYRMGWGDSANRLFTHLLPVVALWMIYVLSASRPDTAPKSVTGIGLASPFKAFVIGCCISVPLVLSFALFYWQPAAPSTNVVVRRADGFCPPDRNGRYSFEVALNPDKADSYAAACSSGSRTIELEIVHERQFRWIDLQEYALSEAWTDFGIRISADGLHWTSVFEHSPKNSANSAARIGPTLWHIDLPANVPMRFITIDYRASLGQNRLLLRRMTLVK